MNIDNVIKNLNTQNDTHIVIGVSAGPDSMALLHSAITNLNKITPREKMSSSSLNSSSKSSFALIFFK